MYNRLNTGNMTDIECSVYYTELADKLIGRLMDANNGDKMVNIIIDRIEYGLTLAEASAKYNISPSLNCILYNPVTSSNQELAVAVSPVGTKMALNTVAAEVGLPVNDAV
jgi:hypothetical protein